MNGLGVSIDRLIRVVPKKAGRPKATGYGKGIVIWSVSLVHYLVHHRSEATLSDELPLTAWTAAAQLVGFEVSSLAG